MTPEKINPAVLVPLDIFVPDEPLRIDLAYATPQSFCGVIYRPEARLWLHENLAAIVVKAARLARDRHGLRMVVYDGLRTVSAQDRVCRSPIVQAHPYWLEGEGRVFAPPGKGAHPRGMAVDVSLETPDGALLDMGTGFDELPLLGNGPDVNRAHREFEDLPPDVKESRGMLDAAMTDAAASLNSPLHLLRAEWWDFRFPQDMYNRFAPLDEYDLPPQMRMTDAPVDGGAADFGEDHFARMKKRLLALVSA